MKHYVIITEGPHDLAVVRKLMKVQGWGKAVVKKDDVPEIWKRFLEIKYPFEDDNLDQHSAPAPTILRDEEERSVAVFVSGGDEKIASRLNYIMDSLELNEWKQVQKLLILFDADSQSAQERKEKLEQTLQKKDICIENKMLKIKNRVLVPIQMYTFPDDCNAGNLENLLLQAADIVYPKVKNAAETYIENASKCTYTNLLKEPKRKKAIVGCIANTLRPGGANQVSIQDNEWISEACINRNAALQKFKEMLDEFLHGEIE